MWINVLIHRLLDLWFSISLFLLFVTEFILITFQLWHWSVIIAPMIVKLTQTLWTAHTHVLSTTSCHMTVRKPIRYEINLVRCSLKYISLLNHFLYSLDGMKSEYGFKSCADSGECINYSVNLGYAKLAISQECCNSDLCNSGPFPGRTRDFCTFLHIHIL